MPALLLVLIALLALAGPGGAAASRLLGGHGLSMHGDLKYPAGFRHFEYVNPRAPRGGQVRLAAIGTFDTLNPFVLRGVAATGIGETFETLMVGSLDEPFSQYGLVAASVEVPEDRSWVAYTLRKEARFHDGSPITAEDVVWTFDTLKTRGHPFYRSYYKQVVRAEVVGPGKVRFTFGKGENRELPLIVGQMPVLSRAWWAGRDFEKTTLEPVLGSGPYRVEAVDAGRSITYRRVRDYWAAGLPVNVGRDNFDEIRYDYYRDTTVALEAFKAGRYDFRLENVARNWATAYTGPAVSQGLIRKEAIRNEVPTGMQAYVLNHRRPLFQDRRVRQALGHAFDFEWINRTLFYGAYTRTASYFSNSELASRGLPEGRELEALRPLRGQVPEEVFTREFRPPATDGSGDVREHLREALRLLGEAGWNVKGGRLVNAQGAPFEFEILGNQPDFERIHLAFAKNLERLGITARVRTVDTAQYQNRLDTFDFDVSVTVWGQSVSPGNEQLDFWHSSTADTPGSRNLAGIKDPAVDRLVEAVIAAPDRESLVARTRALDRVLLWGHHVIPHWHVQSWRVAYWDRFARPAVAPRYGLGFDTWWVDPQKDAELARRRR